MTWLQLWRWLLRPDPRYRGRMLVDPSWESQMLRLHLGYIVTQMREAELKDGWRETQP
jgi:hypothetical protein